MTINSRIRSIRKDLRISQKDFGAKIGLGQGAVSFMEQNGNTVIEQNIRLICETFGINEAWLRTGEGEREAVSAASDPFLPLRQKHQLSFIEEQVLRIYFKLDETARASVCQYVQTVAEAIAEPPPAEEPPRAAEKRVSDAERAEMHRLLDEEIDAEEKARSVSKDGSIAKRA
nr:helix-turn-helix transcriptional regulator [uncultured Selenomonas sp.]